MDIAGKRILVTGAAGHVGGHIVEHLLRESPAEIVAVDVAFGGGETETPALYDNKAVTRVTCDVTDAAALRKLTEGIDAAVHTAARLSREVITDLRKGFEVNIGGTFNLIEACVAAKVRKFVLTSSSSVYDGRVWPGPITESCAYDPASLYGTSKSTGEMLLRVFHAAHGLEYAALRCTTIYGVRQSLRSNTARLVPESFDRIENGQPPLVYGDGTATYDYVNVADVARAHVAGIKTGVPAGAYNIATGIPTTVAQAAQAIADVAGYKGALEFAEQGNRNNIPSNTYDVSKAERELGFKAQVSLRQGLEDYREWRNKTKSEAKSRRQA